MAINGDGSIILTTKIDETGLKKGLGSIKKISATAGKAFLAVGAAAATATVAITKMAVSAYSEFEQLAGGVQKIFDKANISQIIEDANNAFLELNMSANDYLRTINDIGATFSATMGDQKGYDTARQGLLAISDYASGTGKNIDVLSEKFTMITRSASSYQSIADQFSGILPATSADFLSQAKAAGFLSDQYTKLTEVPIAEYQQAVTKMLSKGVEELGLAGNTAAEASTTISGSLAMVKASWQNLLTAMTGGGDLDRAMNNFVYSLEKFTANIVPVIERTLSGLGQAIQRTLPMLVQTVVSALVRQIPTLAMAVYNMIVGLFKGVVSGIKALFNGGTAKATEVIKENVSEISSSAGSASDSMDEFSNSTDKAGKAAKKTLAAFDELNILSGGTSEDGGETTAPIAGSGVAVAEEASENSALSGAVQEVKGNLEYLLPTIEIALVAIGLILLAMGNIPWGIGFVVGGAYLYSVDARSQSAFDFRVVSNDLKAITDNIEKALLGIGVILMSLGQIPWGIGFIIAGAAIYAAKEVRAGGYDTADVKTKLALVMEAVSVALIGIGVMLIFFGQIALGIGFVAVGKAMFDVQEQQLQEGQVTTKLQQFLLENQGLIVGIGLALVVIALILLTAGVFSPLSIGLLVGGAAALATEESMNPGGIKEIITQFFEENAGLVVGVSIALIVLGIILLFTGVGIPLALGLIVAGGGALATEVVLNWDFIVDKVREVWQKVKDFWNEHIAPIFTAEWWKNLGKDVMNGLIAGFEAGINGIIGMFEKMINWIVDGLNKISFDVPEWVPGIGGKTFGFNIQNVKFDRVSIPRLAKGAVIPPNREFLAVLGDQRQGTNIEAPLQTIVDAFNIALAQNGSTGGNTELVLEIDGREFGRAVVEQGGKENRRVGTRLVIA